MSLISLIRLLCVAIICLSKLGYVDSIHWKEDAITFTDAFLMDGGRQYVWNMTSNRYIPRSDAGHFVLQFEYDGRFYSTNCMTYGSLAQEMEIALNQIVPIFRNGGVSVQRRGDGSVTYYFGYEYTFDFGSNTTAALFPLEASYGVDAGCDAIETYGRWNDSNNWVEGTVPTTADTVTIPSDSGQIVLTEDVEVENLNIQGGRLVLHHTWCPEGYIGGYGDGTKCYSIAKEKRDWLDAQDQCDNFRPKGSGYLARISSEAENQLVKLLCQSTGDSDGCWIGLRRTSFQNDWAWIGPERSEMDPRFRAWGEREPSNKTMPDTGERCAKMAQSRSNFFAQQGGFWEDDWCQKKHHYICELHGTTTSYSLTVSSTLEWESGTLFGAGILQAEDTLEISGEVAVDWRATLLNKGTATVSGATILGMGGGRIINRGSFNVALDSKFTTIGNSTLNSSMVNDESCPADVPPIIRNEKGGEMMFSDGSVKIAWILENKGFSNIQVASNGELEISGGGLLVGGSLEIDETSAVNITSGALALQNTDLFVLSVSADRTVVGEQDTGDIGVEGHYKLSVKSSDTSVETTQCIPYNATDIEVQEALEALPSVSSVGGVYVRRWGRSDSESWEFGYRYSIYFDAKPINYDSTNNITVDLSCYGSDICQCADILGPVITSGSINLGCSHPNGSANAGQTSDTDPNLCVLQPSITVEHERKQGACLVSGAGALTVTDGHHLLSPSITPTLTVAGGQVNFMAHHFSADNLHLKKGIVMVSGLSHEAEAGVNLLYANDSSNGRDLPILFYPANFVSNITELKISGGEMRLVATSNSTLLANSFLWTGGNISGLPTLEVVHTMEITSLDVNESNSSMHLKNGVTLKNTGNSSWTSGSIKVSEGATFINTGYLQISSMGSMSYDILRDQWSGQRDWKEAWYLNPLCWKRCEKPASVVNLQPGVLVSSSPCSATLHATVYNYGQFITESGAHMTLAGGGTNLGNLSVEGNGHLELSGGEFYFTPSMGLKGSGVVEYSGGSHTPPDFTECTMIVTGAHIVYSAVGITLIQGLILDSGQMDILSTSTIFNITGNLTITGGVLEFPAILENAAIHPTHLHQTHWTSDRSTLTVGTLFQWAGGIIRGNVDVYSIKDLEILGATKFLEGLAHVINTGKALWEGGDIIHSSNAAFTNHGTLQLGNPETFTGRVLQNQEEEVCCPKEEKAIFSWD